VDDDLEGCETAKRGFHGRRQTLTQRGKMKEQRRRDAPQINTDKRGWADEKEW
jgi:hypothetical protein